MDPLRLRFSYRKEYHCLLIEVTTHWFAPTATEVPNRATLKIQKALQKTVAEVEASITSEEYRKDFRRPYLQTSVHADTLVTANPSVKVYGTSIPSKSDAPPEKEEKFLALTILLISCPTCQRDSQKSRFQP